jgi:hypothetical protein
MAEMTRVNEEVLGALDEAFDPETEPPIEVSDDDLRYFAVIDPGEECLTMVKRTMAQP